MLTTPPRNQAPLAIRARSVALVLFSWTLALGLRSGIARGQALTVMPVHVQMAPGQKAATLSVTNAGTAETSIQIRAFAWAQPDGNDQLTATDAIVASPPIATIRPGVTQIVRLILRRSPEAREDTYRILLDQIPPPVEQGTVHVVLRISIPIFAQPRTRAVSLLKFRLERSAQQVFLTASNDGVIHEVLRGLELGTNDGKKLDTNFSGSQYVLAGATRRWLIAPKSLSQPAGDALRVTASSLNGVIQQQVHSADGP